MSLYDEILEELKNREVLYYDRYCPYYVISIGCHMFNLWNKGHLFGLRDEEQGIYYSHSLLVDTRAHIFMVTPSGFGKTFHCRQFLEPGSGIIEGALPCAMEGPMSEAAWVGTGNYVDGEPVVIPGAAWEYRMAIVGVEEFSALVDVMQTSYSRTLHPQLLTSLDSGIVRKRLRGQIKLAYNTGVTLWTGDRPATFSLASGMARRLVFLNFFPTRKDIMRMRSSMRKGENIKYNKESLANIKAGIAEKFKRLSLVESVVFEPSAYDLLTKMDVMPYEELVYKKLMIGYHVMKSPLQRNLRIYINKELEELILREKAWRDQIRRGADLSHVFAILSDHGNQMTKKQLLEKLADFGMTYVEGAQLLNRLLAERLLYIKDGYVKPYFRR